jgi:hypothetical protein
MRIFCDGLRFNITVFGTWRHVVWKLYTKASERTAPSIFMVEESYTASHAWRLWSQYSPQWGLKTVILSWHSIRSANSYRRVCIPLPLCSDASFAKLLHSFCQWNSMLRSALKSERCLMNSVFARMASDLELGLLSRFIVARLWTGRPSNRGSIPSIARPSFFLLQNVQASSGARQALLSCIPWVPRARARVSGRGVKVATYCVGYRG